VLSSARWIGSARKGSSELALIAFLVACSCRAVPDGSTAPAPSGVPEASTPGPRVAAPAPEPSAPKAATTASVGDLSESKPAPAPVSKPQASEGDFMLENLAAAIRETPFSAVVQHLRVDVVPLGSDEVKFVYQVRVIENIRGPKLKNLTYYSIAEKGEDPNSAREPVILTLCKDQEGFYWPGTGAQFSRTKNTSAVVEKVRPELSADQKVFEQCRPAS
jgi:hypothetical protein